MKEVSNDVVSWCCGEAKSGKEGPKHVLPFTAPRKNVCEKTRVLLHVLTKESNTEIGAKCKTAQWQNSLTTIQKKHDRKETALWTHPVL